MKIDSYIKSKTIYFVLTLVVVIILSVSSSYAFVNRGNDVLNNGLTVNYLEDKKTSMYVEKTINIKNDKVNPKDFDIYVSSLGGIDSISLDKVKYSVNDGIENRLKRNNNSSIYSGVLDSNEEINIKLKFWVSYDLLDNNDQGKNLSIDINVQ